MSANICNLFHFPPQNVSVYAQHTATCDLTMLEKNAWRYLLCESVALLSSTHNAFKFNRKTRMSYAPRSRQTWRIPSHRDWLRHFLSHHIASIEEKKNMKHHRYIDGEWQKRVQAARPCTQWIHRANDMIAPKLVCISCSQKQIVYIRNDWAKCDTIASRHSRASHSMTPKR